MSLRSFYHAPGSGCLLPISLIVIFIWIMFITELGVGRKVENDYNRYWAQFPDRTSDGKTPHPPYPEWRWSSGSADGPNGPAMFFWRGYALILDTIHLPIHHYLLHKQRLHPITALSTSVFMFCAWSSSVALFTLLNYITENWSLDKVATDELAQAGGYTQFVLVLLYLGYMICSAKAVHVWRKEKKIKKYWQQEGERSTKEGGRSPEEEV